MRRTPRVGSFAFRSRRGSASAAAACATLAFAQVDSTLTRWLDIAAWRARATGEPFALVTRIGAATADRRIGSSSPPTTRAARSARRCARFVGDRSRARALRLAAGAALVRFAEVDGDVRCSVQIVRAGSICRRSCSATATSGARSCRRSPRCHARKVRWIDARRAIFREHVAHNVEVVDHRRRPRTRSARRAAQVRSSS